MFAPVPPGNATIAFTDRGRNVRNFKAAVFTGMRRPAKGVDGLQEKRSHEERLKTARLSFLHFFLNCKQAVGAHRLLRKRIAVQERPEVLAVESLVDLL